ncbi:peptidoglycan DD-metalloendopeptidase family protein [Candidatus Acetatifactor stercoripullorum]|uniref:peptidoglycan DD-metalloendopeptidase family protein n=1 Tax=Candidatus Acetatifactor stercoripullorum TaxID=2838414 RepID=UPI00298E1CF7|nr:peptidoglycan DD-metalloendopeptidase family protein [Candidatus Acetatifactor stercoripullorum]
MESKKHKRKTNHVVIVTSDAVDANVRQFRIKPWLLQTIIVILCVVLGAFIGYFIYEERIWVDTWKTVNQKNTELTDQITLLEEEKQELQAQVESQNEKIQILSETVNQKTQSESELARQLEEQSLPTEFPLTGSASMEEAQEGDPICVFTASAGTMVVAAASGTVTAVNDDGEYGHNVWIDHGNGYVTIYRNQGDVMVNQGDSVVQGTTLFLIGEENTTLGYQMMKDGAYINPMDMLAISG